MRNDNKNELIDKWFEFRSEEIETLITDEDRDNMFSFQYALDEILKFIPADKKEWAIKEFHEYDNKCCDAYNYWIKKYYMAGWCDGIDLYI